jgi:hypothetical protein
MSSRDKRLYGLALKYLDGVEIGAGYCFRVGDQVFS